MDTNDWCITSDRGTNFSTLKTNTTRRRVIPFSMILILLHRNSHAFGFSEKPAVIKKLVNPIDLPLKKIAGLIAYSGDEGQAYKDSGR